MSIYVGSLCKGFVLGSTVIGLSFVLDRTVSRPSYINMSIEDIHLYNQGINANIINLCVMSPVFYSVLVTHVVRTPGLIPFHPNPLAVLFLVFIHNVFYYLVHKSFHTTNSVRGAHYFHHKFDNLMLPSVGNAVSKREFLMAYIFPFYMGAIIIPCNEASLFCSVAIIALLNMAIHCKEFEELPWIAWLVSPKKHITHHIERTKHYSAPFLDLDEFLEKETINRIKND